MKKNLLFLPAMSERILLTATAVALMAGCADESYIGDQDARDAANGERAISFNMSTPAATRADGATAAAALGYQFKVYGVKKTGSDYSNVFSTGAYSSDAAYSATPYNVWYTASTAGTTTSDTKDWDYVGSNGSTYGTTDHTVTLSADQTVKYWDFGADQYEFVAYSATVSAPTISKLTKNGFTVEGTAAQLAGLYVADKLTILEKNNTATLPPTSYNKIGNIVQFTFRSAATKVRLGIYETIPGYAVRNVSFRPNASEFTATTANAKLSGSFNGGSSAASGTYNVMYNATTGVAEFDATAAASTSFDFGTFASATPTDLGTTATAPMWASGSADYQSVLPNTDNVAAMVLKVDYDLYNATTQETIHVKGATAVVPEAFMTWNPNYAYTYLFKISDNTNGTSGAEGTSPAGLFPITFDALTVATTDGSTVGTITTLTTPAITTFQNGSVSTDGITYANANGAIYVTVNTAGTLATLTAGTTVKLYTVAAGTTEADLLLAPSYAKTEVTTGDDALSVLAAAETVNGVAFAASTTAKFTPKAGTTYAIEYISGDTKAYKVIQVAAAS